MVGIVRIYGDSVLFGVERIMKGLAAQVLAHLVLRGTQLSLDWLWSILMFRTHKLSLVSCWTLSNACNYKIPTQICHGYVTLANSHLCIMASVIQQPIRIKRKNVQLYVQCIYVYVFLGINARCESYAMLESNVAMNSWLCEICLPNFGTFCLACLELTLHWCL